MQMKSVLLSFGLAFGASSLALAQSPDDDSRKTDVLPKVRVEATEDDVSEPYAGGQVARGAELGLLGSRDIFETPFNVTSFTAQAMADQQVTRVADIIKRDPSVQVVHSPSSFDQGFLIRGLRTTVASSSFDGGPGVLPSYAGNSSVGIERVEVIKGANTLLSGVSLSGLSIGGALNLVPKRATDTPVTSLTTQYDSHSQYGISGDLGRRFGSADQFGMRVNAFAQEGETAIDDANEDRHTVTVALDYRTDRARLFLDLGEDSYETRGLPTAAGIDGDFPLPKNPRLGSNFAQPFTFSDQRLRYVVARGEYDINEHLTLRASANRAHSEARALLSFGVITDADGTLDEYFQNYVAVDDTYAFTAGLTARFTTGPIEHELVFSAVQAKGRNAQYGIYDGAEGSVAPVHSNLYDPARPPPPTDLFFMDYDDADGPLNQGFRNENPTIALADTLAMLEDRLQLTLGVRQQRISWGYFDASLGGAYVEAYDDKAYTPAAAVLFKPYDRVSIYGNYIESLESGPSAPDEAINRGEIFSPSRNWQIETGVKVDWGQFGATADVFQIVRPSGLLDPVTHVFSVNGKQRNRGMEVNVFGELAGIVRLNGGVQYLEPKLIDTQDGTFDGNEAPGVARLSIALSAEADVPAVSGLTVTGDVSRRGSTYVDDANTRKAPGFTLVDVGLRYAFHLWDRPAVLRGGVNNVFNEDGGTLDNFFLMTPRTYQLSASMDF